MSSDFSIPDFIYICGAVSSDPDYENKFSLAEKKIKAKYPRATIMNPITFCKEEKADTWLECMAICKGLIDFADVIVTLPDWQQSYGAKAEVEFAQKRGLKIVSFSEIV